MINNEAESLSSGAAGYIVGYVTSTSQKQLIFSVMLRAESLKLTSTQLVIEFDDL